MASSSSFAKTDLTEAKFWDGFNKNKDNRKSDIQFAKTLIGKEVPLFVSFEALPMTGDDAGKIENKCALKSGQNVTVIDIKDDLVAVRYSSSSPKPEEPMFGRTYGMGLKACEKDQVHYVKASLLKANHLFEVLAKKECKEVYNQRKQKIETNFERYDDLARDLQGILERHQEKDAVVRDYKTELVQKDCDTLRPMVIQTETHNDMSWGNSVSTTETLVYATQNGIKATPCGAFGCSDFNSYPSGGMSWDVPTAPAVGTSLP